MNDVMNINTDVADTRDISVVTNEILAIKQQTLACAVEIGRRMCEAKQMLPHGEWGKWLKNEVDFSQSTANNMMKLFKEYGSPTSAFFVGNSNSQALGKLSITNALRLLSAPEKERSELAEKVVNENLSSRELEKLIKERDTALKEAKAAEKRVEDAEDGAARTISEIQEKLDVATKAHDTVLEELNSIKNQPIDAVTSEQLAQARAEERKKVLDETQKDKETSENKYQVVVEREKKLSDKIASLKKQLKAAENHPSVDTAIAEKNAEIEELKRKLKTAAPETAQFAELFNEAQRMLSRLRELADGAGDNKDKLNSALDKMLETFGR